MPSNDDITLVVHERLSRHYMTEGKGHSRFFSNSPRLGGKNTKWFKKKSSQYTVKYGSQSYMCPLTLNIPFHH